MVEPLISVIIPAYNEENYIRPTLHNLQIQTFQNFETIVVANGCTDTTEQIIKKREHKTLKLLSLPKPNVSIARNEGAKHAKGKMLLFLDADTILEPDAIQKIIDSTQSKNNQHQPITEQPSEKTFSKIYGTTKTAGDNPELKYKTLLTFKNFYLKTGFHKGSSGAFYCSKDLFHERGGYKEDLKTAEHHDLIQRIKRHGTYIFTPTTATTSLRRYREWGVRKLAIFWIKRYLGKKSSEHYYEHIHRLNK